MPSGGCAAMQGVGGAQMSSNMLQSLIGMQADGQSCGPPSTSDMASKMISDLDTNGDGVISLEEATASGDSNASQAFAALDADGDGSLTTDELSTALKQMGPPPGGPPPGGGHHRASATSSSDLASQLLSDLDTDGEDGLSLNEVGSALGEDTSSSSLTSGFSSLDSDGDGKLSLAELTSAFDRYAAAMTSQFASQDSMAA